jgi:hypothetical protein
MHEVDGIYSSGKATFYVQVDVPLDQAGQFADAMTGNDDDILLAAERGIRDKLEMGEEMEEVELSYGPDEDAVKARLEEIGRGR